MIVVILIIFRFTLMHVPKNLENAPAQVFTQLRHWCIPLVNGIMNSEIVPQKIKSFIDLANMAKGLMDENQQPFVQQDLQRLFPSTRGGMRGDESRKLHRIGVVESSVSTTTDTKLLQHPLPQNGRLQKCGNQKLGETPSKFAIFFHLKTSDFKLIICFMSILKFGLPRLLFEVFRTKTKTELF